MTLNRHRSAAALAALLCIVPRSHALDLGDEPPQLEFAFEEKVTLDRPLVIGPTSEGIAQAIPITGGTFSGPNIAGTIVSGGADYQALSLRSGEFKVDAIYMLKTDDGQYIQVHNPGLCRADSSGRLYFYTRPTFTAGAGRYRELSNSIYVGRGLFADGQLTIRFYKVVNPS